ncbi:MAG: hypothetical protein WDN30_00620 [Pararobbsia sp.]
MEIQVNQQALSLPYQATVADALSAFARSRRSRLRSTVRSSPARGIPPMC